jgi:hypothetical protein
VGTDRPPAPAVATTAAQGYARGTPREVTSLMSRHEQSATALPAPADGSSAPGWSATVVWLLVAVWLFNAADLVLTVDALNAGRAEELNPFMDALFAWGLGPVVLYKIGVVSAGLLSLWLLRRHRIVLYTAAALAVVFGLLVVYHTVGLWLYLYGV